MGRNRWSSESLETDQPIVYMFGDFYVPKEIHVEKDWAIIDIEVHISPERDLNLPFEHKKDYLCIFIRIGDTNIRMFGYDSYEVSMQDNNTIYEYSTGPRFFSVQKVN